MTIRLRFLNIIFLLWAILIILRLMQWQIFDHEKFTALAESQHYGFFEIPAKRGDIKTSDGYSIVTNQTVYLIYAQTTEIKDAAKKQDKSYEDIVRVVAKELSPFLIQIEQEKKIFDPEKKEEFDEKELIKNKEKELEAKFLKEGAVWVPILHKAPEWLVNKIKEYKLPGFGFEKESSRFYPEASLAAHLLGFVGNDSTGKDKGYFGLEGYYDKEIRGRGGRLREEIDALGRPILVGERVGVDSVDGRNITTTIDRGVQYIVEKELEKGIKKYGAKSASAIVMDPKTGEILALANLPKYDPYKWNQYPSDSYKNPTVADNYEPGSTFKVITFASGMNEGKITPETICKCEGPKKVGGYTITTWNNKYYPNSTMIEVLQHSDNIGASEIAEALGKEKMISYIKDFGFGEETKVDLEEEAEGILKDLKDWQPIDLDTVSFGQGISVTALQMVRAIGAIANGGKLMKPYIVKNIEGKDRTIEIKPKMEKQVIKDSVAKVVGEVMVKVVEGGETKRLVPKGYRVAGKTGTAQIPVEGRYDPNRTIASFVGFAPVEDPKYVMLVRYSEPTSSKYGSETAAPTFFEITKELFNYWGIPPNK